MQRNKIERTAVNMIGENPISLPWAYLETTVADTQHASMAWHGRNSLYLPYTIAVGLDGTSALF